MRAEDLAVAAGEAPKAALADGTANTPQAPHPRFFASRRRASSAASVSGPSGAGVGGSLGSLAAAARRPSIAVAREDRGARRAGGSDDRMISDDDEDDAALVDPGMLPKELSAHWSGFLTEIFVFRHTVMPTLLPQIIVAFVLGVLAQMLKVRACGADVVAAAECQTTFDITGHQVVSVSLKFPSSSERTGRTTGTTRGNWNCTRSAKSERVFRDVRENRPREGAVRGDGGARVPGLGAGTFADSPTRAPRESFRAAAEKIREDRTELLRLTNVLYATMRHILRDLRVGGPNGEDVSDEDCVMKDATGKPPLPDMLREGESKTLLALMPSNRYNWVAMRVQMIVETHRRLGNISERAAFEIYQQLEACLSAYKAMERIVSTPIPFTYLPRSSSSSSSSSSRRRSCSPQPSTGSDSSRPSSSPSILRHQRDGQTHRGPVRLEAALPRPLGRRTPRVPRKSQNPQRRTPIATRNPRETPRPNAPAKVLRRPQDGLERHDAAKEETGCPSPP